MISTEGVSVDTKKIEAIVNWKLPTNVTEITKIDLSPSPYTSIRAGWIYSVL